MVVQVCFPMHLYGKKYLKILFTKTEDVLRLNLCIYYCEHLHVCSGCVTQVSELWPVGLLFRFWTITWVSINRFSPNLVCALILWFWIANGQTSSIFTILCLRHVNIFSFPEDNLSKYQQVFTKLGICLWRSCSGLLMGIFHKFLTRVTCPRHIHIFL